MSDSIDLFALRVAAELVKLNDNRAKLKEAREKVAALECEGSRLANGLVEMDNPSCPSWLEHGDWECSTSPTGRCVYDEQEDSIHDFCLFCGDPEERK